MKPQLVYATFLSRGKSLNFKAQFQPKILKEAFLGLFSSAANAN